jgi:hypothetical protein
LDTYNFALLKINTNQEKNKALKTSTTKPFSQWTVIALREFLKERGVDQVAWRHSWFIDGANVPFLMR